MQATVGDDVILKASLVSGDAAPETIGPTCSIGVAAGSPRAPPPTGTRAPRTATCRQRSRQSDASRNKNAGRRRVASRTTPRSEQHYRRCDALRLEYGGAYRAVERVEWSGHAFRADVDGTHLAAVLDARAAGCVRGVRANTFIPVGVKTFRLQRRGDWTPSRRCVVHGEILEQHPEFLVADLQVRARRRRVGERSAGFQNGGGRVRAGRRRRRRRMGRTRARATT